MFLQSAKPIVHVESARLGVLFLKSARPDVPEESTRPGVPEESARLSASKESERSGVPEEPARSGVPEESTRPGIHEETARPGLPGVSKIRCSCSPQDQVFLKSQLDLTILMN